MNPALVHFLAQAVSTLIATRLILHVYLHVAKPSAGSRRRFRGSHSASDRGDSTSLSYSEEG